MRLYLWSDGVYLAEDTPSYLWFHPLRASQWPAEPPSLCNSSEHFKSFNTFNSQLTLPVENDSWLNQNFKRTVDEHTQDLQRQQDINNKTPLPV